jgi:hypothetical protein
MHFNLRTIVIFGLHKGCLCSAKSANADPTLPPAVQRVLSRLGADIHDAQRRRGLSMVVTAERAFTSHSTLQRVKTGSANVSVSIYAAVLQALGLLDGLDEIATSTRRSDIAFDSLSDLLDRSHDALCDHQTQPHVET